MNFTRVIYESSLSPELKATASVLLTFANKDGACIYPSVQRLGWMLGLTERQARTRLTRLIQTGVFVAVTPRTGGRGRTTRYQFVPAALPPRPTWTPRNPEAHFPLSTHKPGSPLPPFETRNPEVQRQKPGSPASLNPEVATSGDLKEDLKDLKELPAAPAFSEKAKKTKAKKPPPPAEADTDDDHPRAEHTPPHRVYLAIGYRALDLSLKDDHSDDIANIAEHFKTLCAQQRVPYTSTIAGKVIAEVVHLREKAKRDFGRQFQQLAGRRFASPLKLAVNT